MADDSDATLLRYLHTALPPTYHEMVNLRAQQRTNSPVLAYDFNGTPPPEEKSYAHYIVTRNIGSMDLPYPYVGIDVPTFLVEWSTVVGKAVDIGLRREADGTWALFQGFSTIWEAWLAGILAPAWVEPGRRWVTSMATSRWS